MFTIHHSQHHNKGQSLVETAIFLPILILLLGGLVEVSNLLVTQNRVSTAARVATGYGAANFQGEEWDDPSTWAVSMANVAKNNVTETLDLDEERWDIWAVKATLNPAATNFTEWNPQHAFGTGAVLTDDEWATREAQIQADVLDALDPAQVGLQVVATVAFHDRHSILGLNAFDIGDLNRIRGLSVMRVNPLADYEGCPLLPIAVSLYNHSVHYPPGEEPDGYVPVGPYENVEFYPFEEDGHYGGQNYYWVGKNNGLGPPKMEHLLDAESGPYAPPTYNIGASVTVTNYKPGTAIFAEQSPGYLYLTKQATESDSSGFGWLRWEKDTTGGANSSQALGDNLANPWNAVKKYDYSPFSEDLKKEESGDGHAYTSGIDTFDLVPVSTGSVSSAKDKMREIVDLSATGQDYALIVFTPSDANHNGGNAGSPDGTGDSYGTGGTGSDLEYEILGFVRVRVLAWYLPGNHNWMLMKFLGFSTECPSSVG